MSYIVPRVLITQEFTQIPVFSEQPLSAFVFGPQYNLYRYTNSDEKSLTAVVNPNDVSLSNQYQAGSDVTYNLPNQITGTFVDADYTQVYFEKAQVQYYPNDLDDTAGAVTRVAYPTLEGVYYPNRFSATDLVFKTANSVDRSDDFSNRDVAIGDVVVLTDESEDSVTVTVKALHPSLTPAASGTVTNDSSNAPTQSEVHNNAVVWAGEGDSPMTPPVNSSVHYYGYNAIPIISDTYTATVTAITGSDLTTARFTIASANGAFTTLTNQSLNGSDVLILDASNNNNLKLDFTSATTPVVGDKWTLAVVAPVARLANGSSITAATPYTGSSNITYILKVVRGGPLYNGSNASTCAKIAITSNALDSSATVNVQSAVAFRVGSFGLTTTISSPTNNGGLILGDIYYVPVTAATNAAVNIIETYQALPASLVSNSASWSITSIAFVANFEVQPVINLDEDLFNWTVDDSAQTVTINEGIVSTNSLIVDGDSNPLALDVLSANIFVTHRDLVVTNSVSIGSVTTADQVEAALGTIDPDNPLSQGTYLASLNANGVPTYFCGVATDDLDGYNAVLALAKKSTSYYGLAPMTFDSGIQQAVVAHVNAMSTPDYAKWRVAWISSPVVSTALIYDEQSDDSDWLGTVTDDPLTAGTQYTLLTVSGATFITDGVRPTDELLINFTTNSDGSITNSVYTVSEVRTEETLVLTTALIAAVNSAIKVQIQRVYTADEQVANLAAIVASYANRRVRDIFPTTAKSDGVTLEGFFIAAACAGLRAGVVPHQGLTNTQLLGFDDLSMTITTFDEDQLDVLAAAGSWIVTQTVVGAIPYIRQQLTTDSTSLNTSEDSITTNTDSISFGLMQAAGPFIGTYNINPNMLTLLRAAIEDELYFRMTETYTVRAGNQLNGYDIVSFGVDPTLQDRVLTTITLDEPYPNNFTGITLII